MRRQYEIPKDFIRRFNRATDAGPAATAGLRHLPIWEELALVLGFRRETAEPTSFQTPTLFTAEEDDRARIAVDIQVMQQIEELEHAIDIVAEQRAARGDA